MFDWLFDYTEPPLTFSIDLETVDCLIQCLIKFREKKNMVLNEIPCHVQNVQRHIKLVTETLIQVYEKENREEMLRVTLNSRI